MIGPMIDTEATSELSDASIQLSAVCNLNSNLWTRLSPQDYRLDWGKSGG